MIFEIGPEAETITVSAGGFVAAPPGLAHSFRVADSGPERWLTIHAPDGGFSAFMRGLRDGMLYGMDTDPDRWLSDHPKVDVFFPDRPEGDWRAEAGYGWIAKVWFDTWTESREAKGTIRDEGWELECWGRKIRVGVRDGYDAQRLAEFVLERWPGVSRIQLRCD